MNDETRDAPIIDEEKLGELRGLLGDGEEGVDGLIDTFFDRIPEVLSDLESTAENGESEELARLAHKVKGESATLGAKRLSLLAKEIELGAREDEIDDPNAAVEELVQVYQETEKAFQEGQAA